MAERVDAIPPGWGGSRGEKYPWDEWLDGSTWELMQGKDFECSVPSIAKLAKDSAMKRGLTVKASIRGDRVYIQAQR